MSSLSHQKELGTSDLQAQLQLSDLRNGLDSSLYALEDRLPRVLEDLAKPRSEKEALVDPAALEVLRNKVEVLRQQMVALLAPLREEIKSQIKPLPTMESWTGDWPVGC